MQAGASMNKTHWQHLIPHRGAMSLLDRVVDFDNQRIQMTAFSHRDITNPLRSEGRLRAVNLCEYAAQTMAVHGGLLAARAGKTAAPGFLVSLRAVKLERGYIDDLAGPLHIHAEKLLDDATSWQYAFRVEYGDGIIASGRAAVMQRIAA